MRFRSIDFRIEIFLTLYFQLGRLFVEVSSVFVDDIVKKQIDENDQHVAGRNEEKIGSFAPFQEISILRKSTKSYVGNLLTSQRHSLIIQSV